MAYYRNISHVSGAASKITEPLFFKYWGVNYFDSIINIYCNAHMFLKGCNVNKRPFSENLLRKADV